MTAIRVVVGEVPRLLRDIIDDAARVHPDIEIFASADTDLSRAVARRGADVVIVAAAAPGASRLHRRVLVDHPQLKVFVVTDEGRAAHLLELRQTPVVEVSPNGLIEAIRAAVAAGRRPRAEPG